MSKIFKVIAAILLSATVLLAVTALIFHEKEPVGVVSDEADRFARQVLESLDVAGWDTTRYLQWTFRDKHHYLWDRGRNAVIVVTDEDSVILDANTATGRAYLKGGPELTGKAGEEAISRAWRNFCNDGFWLYAPFKIFDPGTVRSIVTLEDGSEVLKVTYMEGGVTPGDSYLWILDENLRPKAWKMWVSIMPVGGIEFTWDGWQQLPTGAWLSTEHASSAFDLKIKDVKSGQTLQELGIASDPFSH